MGFQVGQGSAATHVTRAVSELFQGFVFEAESTSGGPAVYYRINVFLKRKAIYIVNVCSFFSFLFASACRLFISWFLHVFENADYFSYSYHLDASRGSNLGTSLLFYCHNKQILNLVLGFRYGGLNESYICFRRREIKAARKTRASQVTTSDKLNRLQVELQYPLELAKMILERETLKKKCTDESKDIWEKRLAFVDLKRKLLMLSDDEDLIDKEKPVKKSVEVT
jgi:hypothetical protein